MIKVLAYNEVGYCEYVEYFSQWKEVVEFVSDVLDTCSDFQIYIIKE